VRESAPLALFRGCVPSRLDDAHHCTRPSSRVVGLSSRVYRAAGRTGLVGFSLLDLVLRTSLRGVPDRPTARRAKHRVVLSWTSAPLQSMTCTDCCRAAPLLRFDPPSTLEASGSDLHRVCLTRLCSVSRLLQPPDALLLPGPSRLCFAPVTPMGFTLQRFSPLACRQDLSARLPLLTLAAKNPPIQTFASRFRSPGTDPRQRPTRHRVHMPAPACYWARDVPDPSFAPVLWMGTSTRRALRRHPARRSSQPSFRLGHRLTGLPSGFPSETPRSGGRQEVSPSCTRCRRGSDRGPKVPNRRLHDASRIAAPGSRERSPVVPNRPPGFGLVRLRPCGSRPAAPIGGGPAPQPPESACTLPFNRIPVAAATFPRPEGERRFDPQP